MPREEIEIIGGNGVKEDLKPGELDTLVDIWFQEMDKPVDTPISETRQLVGGVLEENSAERQLAEAQWKKERRPQLVEDLREAMKRGDMTIARKNGKVVGMVRVVEIYQTVHSDLIEGRIFEIGKALTIPEVQGQGIYKVVSEQAIANLRKKYGDVSILAGTKNDIIKKMYVRDGWREISFGGYLHIYGAPDEYIKSRKDKDDKDGWTAFLYTPRRDRRIMRMPWDGKPL